MIRFIDLFAGVGGFHYGLKQLECERLQGFPDNWTQYGANGELISDTQRYKMMGNAVTTAVVTATGKLLV